MCTDLPLISASPSPAVRGVKLSRALVVNIAEHEAGS